MFLITAIVFVLSATALLFMTYPMFVSLHQNGTSPGDSQNSRYMSVLLPMPYPAFMTYVSAWLQVYATNVDVISSGMDIDCFVLILDPDESGPVPSASFNSDVYNQFLDWYYANPIRGLNYTTVTVLIIEDSEFFKGRSQRIRSPSKKLSRYNELRPSYSDFLYWQLTLWV